MKRNVLCVTNGQLRGKTVCSHRNLLWMDTIDTVLCLNLKRIAAIWKTLNIVCVCEEIYSLRDELCNSNGVYAQFNQLKTIEFNRHSSDRWRRQIRSTFGRIRERKKSNNNRKCVNCSIVPVPVLILIEWMTCAGATTQRVARNSRLNQNNCTKLYSNRVRRLANPLRSYGI